MTFSSRAFAWGFGATALTGWLHACQVQAAAGHWFTAWSTALIAAVLAVLLLAPLVGARLPTACELGPVLFPPPRRSR